MFCCTLLYVHSSIVIIFMGRTELVALLNLTSWCLMMVERLFLAVPRGCLQFVIVVFPDHIHLLFLSMQSDDEALPSVKEQKHFSLPWPGIKPRSLDLQAKTLYHIAVKAGFYRKVVEVCYIYLDPVKFTHPIRPWISSYRNHVKWDQGDIYAQNGHRMGYLGWAPLS